MEDRDMFIRYDQYHGCWNTGDIRSQCIGGHGIDLFLPQIMSKIFRLELEPGMVEGDYPLKISYVNIFNTILGN